MPSIVCDIFRHLFLLSKGRAGHNLPVDLIRDPHLMVFSGLAGRALWLIA